MSTEKRGYPKRALESKAKIYRGYHPRWMDSKSIDILHTECDENGVHTVSVVQSTDQSPRIVGKYVETNNGLEELFLFKKKDEDRLRLFMTDVEIGALALRLARHRKQHPEQEEVVIEFTVNKDCEFKGKTITVFMPLYWTDENDKLKLPVDYP
jgi:hypothetical protein